MSSSYEKRMHASSNTYYVLSLTSFLTSPHLSIFLFVLSLLSRQLLCSFSQACGRWTRRPTSACYPPARPQWRSACGTRQGVDHSATTQRGLRAPRSCCTSCLRRKAHHHHRRDTDLFRCPTRMPSRVVWLDATAHNNCTIVYVLTYGTRTELRTCIALSLCNYIAPGY